MIRYYKSKTPLKVPITAPEGHMGMIFFSISKLLEGDNVIVPFPRFISHYNFD